MSGNSEMVERVARAICTADGYDPDYDGWDIGFGPNKAWYEKHARAAIEAIEPIVEQAFRDGLVYGNNVKDADADLAWSQSKAKAALSPSLKEQDDLEAVAESIGMAPASAFPPSASFARQQGFTGNTCSNCCGSRMTVAGHCEVCADCGTTTGCS